MSIILSLISGKGGSGKTTIALGLSKMLSDCGIKVLLVDCDIATNGATYFFESKLINKKTILSLSDIVNIDYYDIADRKPLSIDEYFSFVPSNTTFPNCITLDLSGSSLLRHLKKDDDQDLYDVVILDCQAGYSNFLRSVLQISTINLVVLEPDAISSSAIRVLYAQVSEIIERKKTYQVFSKITDEEYEVYNKVTSGTLFDSLPPIVFNWEVRKAFAFAQVPEMTTTNNDFGKNVFQLARVLFPVLDDRLVQYLRKILINEQEMLQLSLEKALDNYRNTRKPIYEYLFSISTLLIPIIGITYFIIDGANFSNYNYVTLLMMSTIALAPISFSILRSKEKHTEELEKKNVAAKYKYEIIRISKELEEIDKRSLRNISQLL